LAIRDAPIVLAVGPDGRVAAVCRAVAGALHPHKVLVERDMTPRDRGVEGDAAVLGTAAEVG
ncbi:MAG TPA: hypothetical protein VIZ22_12770, partial [Candidatus Limnocylindrales bacterium]